MELLFLILAATASGEAKAGTVRHMGDDTRPYTTRELRVDRVLAFVPAGASGVGNVETERSGSLVVRNASHARRLAELAASHDWASIEYERASREVTAVSSALSDVVLQVRAERTQLTVQLMKRPTLLLLDRRHPRFAALEALLREASANGMTVAIGALPGSSAIEDAIAW